MEADFIRLNWEKAAVRLGWRPIYTWEEALAEIVTWFKAFVASEDMYDIGRQHLINYTNRAHDLGLAWAMTS
jgi:hypothetical protein